MFFFFFFNLGIYHIYFIFTQTWFKVFKLDNFEKKSKKSIIALIKEMIILTTFYQEIKKYLKKGQSGN